MNIKSIIKKILNYDVNAKLIKQGVLIIGDRTDTINLKISIPSDCLKKGMIIIGSDCIINGSIVLYNENAKVEIGDRVYIGPETSIFCYNKICFQDDILVSWGCTFIDTNAHSLNWEERKKDVLDWKTGNKDWSKVLHAPINIGNKCWIGFNSSILKGVIVGDESVVAAASLVSKTIPPKSVFGGNPASLIKIID